MRIVFIGQAAFGSDVLKALVDQGEEVVGVFTVPDKPGVENPVKETAESLNLPVSQPRRLRDPEAIEWARKMKPDLFVLAFVTDFVPLEMIQLASKGGINYHPSLLPKYRGGSAMNWAIIYGETESGVTVHYIDDGVDTGDIVLQEKVEIGPDETVKDLYFKKLYPLGIKMICEAVKQIREGTAARIPQDESKASFQFVIKEKDCIINWNRPNQEIYNLIRGSSPGPGATTSFRGEKFKIWEARVWGNGSTGKKPGEIVAVEDDRVVIASANGAIAALRVQLPDTKKISAAEFIEAKKPLPGEILG